VQACAKHFADQNTDVIFYAGQITRVGYERFCKILSKNSGEKLLLVLSTVGGDPNAGYRIARAAIHHYGAENFSIVIPRYCKSAGTLICIGATRLVMANQAELGPLDIQLRKEGELFQQSSGLDILRGMTHLQQQALSTFSEYLLDINAGSGLSTKIASEIASNLVIGLYQPLFAQVDPVKLGEMSAALEIARRYGERLDSKSKSLGSSSALNNLIVAYPTHGFVIDRSEARDLFKNVVAPDENEKILCHLVRDGTMSPDASNPIVVDFISTVTPEVPAPTPEENPNEQPLTDEKPEGTEPAEVPHEPGNDGRAAEVDDQQHDAVGGNQGDARADEGAKVG
jgi:hypothetical protein